MSIQVATNWRRFFGIASVVVGGLAIAACSGSPDPFAGKGSPVYKKSGKIPKGGGRRHLGKPYTVAGRKFYPKANPNYDRTGMASWYGGRFHRRQTANGEWYDMNALTAAHKTLPLPSYALVTNVATGKKIVVRINDRGPFVHTRIIDLSRRSAQVLGTKRAGTAKVRVQYIGPAPLNDDGRHLMAMNRQLANGTPKNQMIARAGGNNGQPRITATSSTYGRGNGYYVQIGAYSVRDNAYRAKNDASGFGNVIVSAANGSWGKIYRVRIGPLASQSLALKTQQRAVNSGHYDARIVSQ